MTDWEFCRCPCRRGQAKPHHVAKKPAHFVNPPDAVAEIPIREPTATTPLLLLTDIAADTLTATEEEWIQTKSAWSAAPRCGAKRAWSNQSDDEKTQIIQIITTVSDRII